MIFEVFFLRGPCGPQILTELHFYCASCLELWYLSLPISSSFGIQMTWDFVEMLSNIWGSSFPFFLNFGDPKVGQTSSAICCLDTWLHHLSWSVTPCLGYNFIIWTPIDLKLCKHIPWHVMIMLPIFSNFWGPPTRSNKHCKYWSKRVNSLDCFT